jgi:hypothetical protein
LVGVVVGLSVSEILEGLVATVLSLASLITLLVSPPFAAASYSDWHSETLKQPSPVLQKL